MRSSSRGIMLLIPLEKLYMVRDLKCHIAELQCLRLFTEYISKGELLII